MRGRAADDERMALGIVSRARAILLIGPTGSGKTPLGELLQRSGLGKVRCEHFDFGAELRGLAAEGPGGELTEADAQTARNVLASGALLTDEQFPIAERLLKRFLAQRDVGPGELLVLNGLPRHAGQARDLEGLLDVRMVVELACGPEVVAERIAANTGGDRAGRTDDDPAAVRRRHETYRQRTAPLIEHYRRCGAEVVTIPVDASTSADEMLRRFARAGPHPL